MNGIDVERSWKKAFEQANAWVKLSHVMPYKLVSISYGLVGLC